MEAERQPYHKRLRSFAGLSEPEADAVGVVAGSHAQLPPPPHGRLWQPLYRLLPCGALQDQSYEITCLLQCLLKHSLEDQRSEANAAVSCCR